MYFVYIIHMSKYIKRFLGPTVVANFWIITEKVQANYASSRLVSSSASRILPKNRLFDYWIRNVSLLWAENPKKTQQRNNNMSFSALSPFLSSAALQSRKQSFQQISIAAGSFEEAMLIIDETVTDDANSEQGTDFPPSTKITENKSSKWKSLVKDVTVQGVPVASSKDIQVDDDTTITVHRNGYGVRTLSVPFGWDVHVYVAALYTDSLISSEDDFVDYLERGSEAFVMEVTFLREVKPSQISIAWKYQLDTSVTHNYGGYKQDRERFLQMVEGAMVANGTMVFEFANNDLRITNQGKYVGIIPGKDFALAFVSMFIGKQPVTTALKEGLLHHPLPPSEGPSSHNGESTSQPRHTISVEV